MIILDDGLQPVAIAGLIIIAVIVVIMVLLFFFYKPIKRYFYKRKYKDFYGKKIYKIALYEDFYLINNFVFKHDDTKYSRIDHILFGNKFIYLINDYYFDGSLTGTPDNQSLVLIQNDKKVYVDNPINDSKLLLKRLSSVVDIDAEMLIGISIVNNECAIDMEQKNQQIYLIQENYLAKLIKAIESRPIAEINADQLQIVVQELDRFNRKGKARRDKRNF